MTNQKPSSSRAIAATRKNATPENATPRNATRRAPGERAREEAAARWQAAKARLLTVARSRSEDKLGEAVPTFARILGWSEHNTRRVLFGLAAQARMSPAELDEATAKLAEAVCRPIDESDDAGAVAPAGRATASLETA